MMMLFSVIVVLLSVVTCVIAYNNMFYQFDKYPTRMHLFHKTHPNINKNTKVLEGYRIAVEPGLLIDSTSEYLVRVGIGTPPQYQYLVVDTGSDITWVQCLPCDHCYPQETSIYQPSMSSTAKPVPCDTYGCAILDSAGYCYEDRCLYEINYLDGSYTKGQLMFDTFTFNEFDVFAVENIAVGCGHENYGAFVGFSGTLGLGGGANFPSQFLGAAMISYCLPHPLSNSVGWLEIGGFDQGDSIQWISIRHSPNRKHLTQNYVKLKGIHVEGKEVLFPEGIFDLSIEGEGGVILDTGTQITRLPKIAYEVLRDKFTKEFTSFVRAPGKLGFDTCYHIPPTFDGVLKFPSVTYHFTDEIILKRVILDIKPTSLMMKVDELGTYCFTFIPTSSQVSIIGSLHMVGTQITIDGLNTFMGFGPHTC